MQDEISMDVYGHIRDKNSKKQSNSSNKGYCHWMHDSMQEEN